MHIDIDIGSVFLSSYRLSLEIAIEPSALFCTGFNHTCSCIDTGPTSDTVQPNGQPDLRCPLSTHTLLTELALQLIYLLPPAQYLAQYELGFATVQHQFPVPQPRSLMFPITAASLPVGVAHVESARLKGTIMVARRISITAMADVTFGTR